MYQERLLQQRAFFDSGQTRSHGFRLEQLQKLRAALLANEEAIYAALAKDLGKSQTEAYVSELGMLLTELSLHSKKLKGWMRPKRVSTNWLNFPSSTKMYQDPLGVVLIIAPWNYPLLLLIGPLIGAISGGNCAVLKPSEMTPATESLLQTIIADTFDPSYILLLTGDGGKVVPELMDGFRFDHVFFTGSIPVGKAVYEMAAKQLTSVTLELGGKSPTVVHADADIATAAKRITMGKWLNAGQTCIAPDYILVEATAKEKLVGAIKNCLGTFYGGDGKVEDYGKIVSQKRFDALVEYLVPAEIIFGGQNERSSLYIAPTLVAPKSLDAPVMQEEIFGPILPILSFETKEEALQIVRRNSHPLAFYLFTNNKELENWWLERVPFGGGCVNNTVYHFVNDRIAFGGIGDSGLGGYHGKYSFYTFTHAKPVLKTPNWFDPKFKYPPFGPKRLKLFKWFIK